jgi:hypothetical protein
LIDFKCVDNPIAKVNGVECSIEFKTSFFVDCSVKSRIYLIYSLYSAALDATLDDVISKTSDKEDLDIQYKEETNWTAYATYITTDDGTLNFTIQSPLKNSGENYNYQLWCISENGKIRSKSINGTWVQRSNKAATVPISVKLNVKANDTVDEDALLKSFDKMFPGRKKYLEKQIALNTSNNTSQSRRLQASQTDSVVYTCFIVPDYSLQRDFTELNAKNRLENQTQITTTLLNNYNSFSPKTTILGVQSASIEPTIGTSMVPILAEKYPKMIAQNSQITFEVMVTNGDANLVVGSRKLDFDEVFTADAIKLNFYNPSTLQNAKNIVLNSFSLTNNVRQNITINVVNPDEKQLVFYYGESLAYPKLQTDVYGQLILEISSSTSLVKLEFAVFILIALILGVLANW